MKKVTVERRNNMVNIDGYSERKTLKGALSDLAKTVTKYSVSEAEGIQYIDENTISEMKNVAGEYYIIVEDIAGSENGNWYMYIRFAE